MARAAAPTKRTAILEDAAAAVYGPRQEAYGHPYISMSQIALGFQAVLATKLAPGESISAEDVALCLIQVKVARLSTTPAHVDSMVDIAGYAEVLARCNDARTAPADIRPGALADAP